MGAKIGYMETLKAVHTEAGLFSLYRGALAAGSGSIVFRASGFSVFEFFFSKWKDNSSLT